MQNCASSMLYTLFLWTCTFWMTKFRTVYIEEPLITSLPTFFLSEVDSLFSWDVCTLNLGNCHFSDVSSVKRNIRALDRWSKSNQCSFLWLCTSFNKVFADFGSFHYSPITLTFLMTDSWLPAKCWKYKLKASYVHYVHRHNALV
jgi:hypothetical protein